MDKLVVICFLAIVIEKISAQKVYQASNENNMLEIQAIFKRLGEECNEKYPIEENEVELFSKNEYPQGKNTGCFIACVFKKAGIFDSQGYLSETSTMNNAQFLIKDKEQLKNIADFFHLCSVVNDEPSDDQGCQRAASAFRCLMTKSQENGYNVQKQESLY